MTDLAVSATGLVKTFHEHGVLAWADVHPAAHLCYLFGERDERVQLAAALAVRALRSGSLCVDLARVPDEIGGWSDDEDAETGDAPVPATPALPADAWPEHAAWIAALEASPAVTVGEAKPDRPRPLRLVAGLLYLERYWADQETVRTHIAERLDDPLAPVCVLEPRVDGLSPEQSQAVRSAIDRRLTVIAGGPGTGKTRVIATIVEAFSSASSPTLVALAAPTGKAAARMTESLRQAGVRADLTASTLHRLLGWKPGSRMRFRHDATNPLPYDVVIVDELSMVSMTLMARLLDALKPTARLILVGDPDQLASVEAGAVLADITTAPAAAPAVVTLRRNFRFAGAIQELAAAIRDGDADAALAVLDGPDRAVRLVAPEDADELVRARCLASASLLHAHALAGDAPAALADLDAHRVICAHRHGRYGVDLWTRTITSWLTEDIDGYGAEGEFYTGRPVLITRNVSDLGLFNGDTGVIMPGTGGPEATFATASGLRGYPPFLLDGLVSVHAMTVHKSQGSQFGQVSVILPDVASPLLTRELLYTAVTRASSDVVLVGTRDAVRTAIGRPALRTSGLRDRLG